MEKRIPKSVCLVGQTEEKRKIFIEEYVIAFLQNMMKKNNGPYIIVFFGDGFEKKGVKHYFIKGAASHRGAGDSLKKMDEFYFQTIGRQYFMGLKGIGWYCMEEGEKDVLEILQKMREQDFGSCKGYYLFFEKNEGMEEYMLHRRDMDENDIHVIPGVEKKRGLKKQDVFPVRKKSDPGRPAPMMAVQVLNMVSLCILIICCIIAVTTLNQYDKMKQLEETVTCLEISMEEQKNLPEE